MNQADLVAALQEVLLAAQDFESRTPGHKNLAPQRLRLREALMHAQLLLSVAEREQQAQRGQHLQQQGYALLRPPARQDEGRATREKPKRRVSQKPPSSKGRKP